MDQIRTVLNELETGSYPDWGRGIPFKSPNQRDKRGRSGKGFTTLFYLDGNRVTEK